MAVRILNVAEKPKMAKGLSRILGNGQERYVRRRDASYMPPIAHASITSASSHLPPAPLATPPALVSVLVTGRTTESLSFLATS